MIVQQYKDFRYRFKTLSFSIDPESLLNHPQAVCMLALPMEEKVRN
jgi:hypothetical protein